MAGSLIRRFTKGLLVLFNILISVLFLTACLSPYVSPQQWTPIGFLSLGVPYMAILLTFFLIFWLIFKPVIALLPLFTLLLGWQQLSVIWAWHISSSFARENKDDSVIRIITWNVRGMYGISNSSYTQFRNRTEIVGLINNLHPDIVCLQEFNNSTNSRDYNYNTIGLFERSCPYYFFTKDFRNNSGTYRAGSITFSRYPILDSGKIKFTGPNAESLIYTDVLKGNDTIRVFNMHLQSFEFSQSDYSDMQKIKDPNEVSLEVSKNLYSKMKQAFIQRAIQADTVRNEIDKSRYPSVICGDFNDVPNSYTYFHIRKNHQDAFLASSFGVGRSFNALAPTLRIDYILPGKSFNVLQFDMVDEGLSDHHLLVTDISLKK